MALAKPSTCAAMPPTTRGGYSQDSISTRIDVTVAAGRVTYAAKVLLGEQDLHFFGEGTHRRLWEWLGAQPLPDGGVQFAVWAPNAKSVRVVGDWDGWVDGDALVPQGKSGVWAGVAKSAAIGFRYKFAIETANGRTLLKADPMAYASAVITSPGGRSQGSVARSGRQASTSAIGPQMLSIT